MNGSKNKALGRGLEALLGSSAKKYQLQDGQTKISEPQANTHNHTHSNSNNSLKELSIDLLRPGKYQPRRMMAQEALQELAESIKSQGIMQPIVVRAIVAEGASSHAVGTYEIIAGERRWRAAQLAGLHAVPVLIKVVADEAVMAMSLIENIQREDLTPIEEAMALQRLQNEFVMTHQQIADAVGKSRATVTNLLRLTELHPEVKKMLEQRLIDMGHGRALLAIPTYKQLEAAELVISKKMSVRETEALVKRLLTNKVENKKAGESLDPNIRKLQEELSNKLGAIISIEHQTKGAGKLIIKYNSLDELDGILEHIR